MHIARLRPEHARPHPAPDAHLTAHHLATNVVDALDRLCAGSHRDEWNVFLLDIRQEAPGEYLARVGIFGPIDGELAIHARPVTGDNVPSAVTRAVAAWIAQHDGRMSPAPSVPVRAAGGSPANRVS